jgi:hypothetical protein
MNRLRVLAPVLSLAAVLVAPPANAGPIIQGGSEVAGFQVSLLPGFMQGYDFTPTSAQSLTALGMWDAFGNGFPAPHFYQVGVWDTATQTLLGSATIGGDDPIDNGVFIEAGWYRYETLAAPVPLAAGTTYTLAFQVGPNTISTFDMLAINYPTLVTDPNVTVPNEVRGLGSGGAFTFPTTTSSPAGPQFMGLVNAQLVPVPEPESALLFGAGVAVLAVLAMRRARRRV